MKLSIVTTLYRSAAGLAEFHRRISESARGIAGEDYELILVNDGSPDNSLAAARALASDDARIVIIDLARNFGQHAALWTGIQQARGDRVFTLDSDLEEAPEWLADFHKKMDGEAVDVVYGVQAERRGNGGARFSGEVYYWAFNLFTGIKIPRNITNARLMTRRYVDALLSHEEREIFLAALWEITGFTQLPVPVDKLDLSPTTYNLSAKIRMMVGSIVSFSSAPLVMIFYLGLAVLLIGLTISSLAFGNWALGARPPEGWTSVLISVWMIGGMIIAVLGVIGIYIHKIFGEVKRRPLAIIRSIEGERGDE